LIFNRSDTNYFQELVRHATGIVLIAGKLHYLNDQGEDEGQAQVPSILVAYGESAFDRIRKVPGIAMTVY
jgi:hypothetical protein